MFQLIWRVGGDFDVDQFLQLHRSVVPEVVWRAGEMGRRERVRTESGFNVSVGEFGSASEVGNALRQSLLKWAHPISNLAQIKAGSEFDIGIVLDDECMSRSIRFDAEVLCLVASSGVSLVVSSYLAT